MKGSILVISGPSGSGKSTLLKKLLGDLDNVYFSISTTTRAKRENEIDGVNYHFISKDEFKKGIKNNEFLEWAKVHKNFYGTSISPVLKALSESKVIIFDIDVQGYKLAKKQFGDVMTSVFISTPSRKVLKKRLKNRNTESKESLEERIKNAISEMKQVHKYDYYITNDNIDKAYKQLLCIAKISQLKSKCFDAEVLLKCWKNNKKRSNNGT